MHLGEMNGSDQRPMHHGSIKARTRVGSIDLTKPSDAVLLVLLDADFEATAILRAERSAVEAALVAPGSRARNERGQMSISKFESIGRVVWSRDGRGL